MQAFSCALRAASGMRPSFISASSSSGMSSVSTKCRALSRHSTASGGRAEAHDCSVRWDSAWGRRHAGRRRSSCLRLIAPNRAWPWS